MHAVLAGGGTAGHVEPALAVAGALRRLRPDCGLTLLGTARGLEVRLVPARGYRLALVPAVPLPRRASPALLAVPARLLHAVRATGALLGDVGADVVVGFGGYVALPAYLAARRRRIPVVVHEANARPGLANRLGARLASRVALAGPAGRLPGGVVVGIPLRPELAHLDRPALRPAALAHFGLRADRGVLLVVGGSQGARRLNRAVAGAAAALAAAGVQVLHATGAAGHAEVLDLLAGAGAGAGAGGGAGAGAGGGAGAGAGGDGAPAYRAVPYLDRMDLAYAAADLVLCRAGALTCAELAAVGLPAVYVPLPFGNGEQRLNAAPVVAAGGGVVVADAELTAEAVAGRVPALLADRERLAAMGRAAARLGRPDADLAVARMALEAAGALA